MGDLGELWDELPMLVQQVLTAGGTGLENPRGLAQLAENEDEMPLLVQQLKAEIPKLVVVGLSDLLWKLIQAARAPAGARKRRSAAMTPMARGEALLDYKQKNERLEEEMTRLSHDTSVLVKKHKGEQMRWATRRERRLAVHEGDPQQREKIEEDERQRWVRVLAEFLKEGDTPRYREARRTLDPEASMSHCAGGVRARTLRKRLRAWRRLRDWLLRAKGLVWPGRPADVADFLEDLTREGCARTVPNTMLAAISFMEERGGIASDDRCSTAGFIVSTVRDMSLRLAAGAPPTKKAPELHIRICVALEQYVLDDEKFLYPRVYAWVLLLKVWAALRTDDLAGISPQHVRYTAAGLELQISRSKTSGPGRRMRWLTAFVSEGVSFGGNPKWLAVGFSLMRSQPFCWDRDFLIPLPTQDLKGTIRKVPNYVDLAGMSRQLLRELRAGPDDDDDGEPLLHPQAVMYYTEHSPRNVLVSLTAALGVPKDRRDYLGRWSPSESDDYLRSMRLIVSELQGLVAEAAANGDGRLGQPDSDHGLEVHLRERGVPEGEVARQLARLRLVRPDPAPSTPPSTSAAAAQASSTPPSASAAAAPASSTTPSATSALGDAASDEEGGPRPKTTGDTSVGPNDNMYLITFSRKRNFRRLHLRDGCYHARCLSEHGEPRSSGSVGPGDFDAACLRCWPESRPPSDSSSDESTSTDSKDSNCVD